MTSALFDSLDELPIYARRDDIISAVDTNQVTIITAETGAGKSTQVPQFLAEHGYRKVIVTQPRILAARNLSARVRQEYSWRLGKDATDLVGYRTAPERDDSPDNVILYCTDGLQLVRELTGSGTSESHVLVLDEIHEWNENMEVLVAWAKKRCQEDPTFKVVLMSATIEADRLAAYFGTSALISVEGRSYNVEKRQGRDVVDEIIQLLDARTSNMLVFLPGKAEIESVAEAIAKAANGVPVIPLHGQLEPEAQQRAFASYPKGKVVLTTNVAQTSITIDDIDVVIDSGLERRSEVRSGVEGLFIEQISRADCLQRAGRAGRTKEGLYILAPLDRMPCTPLEERPNYGVPEIMRKHIDRLVLRLANIGIDIESLDFYHSPSRKTMQLAKRTLVDLGALTGAGQVTPIGRKMEQFPVESSYARMLVEAEQYSADVQAKLAAVIAIQEVGGIVKGSPRYSGWRQFTRQTRSDLLAQYDVYLAMPTINPDDYEEMGIIGKNVTKAEDVIERLHRDLNLGEVALLPIEESETEQLLQSIVAGQLHQIWAIEPNGEAVHIATKQKRVLSSGTVAKHAPLVVGTPFDLQIPTPKGLETLHLVNDVTAVDPKWLESLAPNLFKVRPAGIYFDGHYGTLATRMVVRFNGRSFEASSAPLLERTPENQKLFITLYGAWLHKHLEQERQALEISNSRRISPVPLRQVQERVRRLANGAISLLELDKKRRIELSKLARLETYLDERFMATLTSSTTSRPGSHHRSRPWQPPHKRKYNRRRDQ
jgi:HrpA-like RNA helicase